MKKIFLIFLALIAFVKAGDETVKIGWYHWSPYQYHDKVDGVIGLDVALMKRIFHHAGYNVEYNSEEKQSWKQNQICVQVGTYEHNHKLDSIVRDSLLLDCINSGGKDAAAGAFKTKVREKLFHVSKEPYREEWNSIYLHIQDRQDFDELTVTEFIDSLVAKNFVLGVVDGYSYTSDTLNRFIQNSLGTDRIVAVTTEEDNFQNLYDENVDVVVADRLVGARILWEKKWGKALVEAQIEMPKLNIHVLFHRDTTGVSDVDMVKKRDEFDESVRQLKANGDIEEITGNYLFPVLMNITVQTEWFYIIEIIGVIFFSIAGLFLAKDQKYGLFGTLLLTTLLAAGGGIMRDVLINRKVWVLSGDIYMYLIVGIGFAGYAFVRINNYIANRSSEESKLASKASKHFHTFRFLVESLALGAYTIVGVGIAAEQRITPLWLWGPILACMTGCGGGVIALALRKQEDNSVLKSNPEPLITLFWGLMFSLFLIWQLHRLNPKEVFLAVIITMIGVLLTSLIFNRPKKKKS